MSFFDENGYQININAWEKTEQDQAAAYITPECVVLELGARYGSVSCAINKNLENPRTQVSVEPDDRVWAVLQANMERNGCCFHILKGFISNREIGLHKIPGFEAGYGTTYIEEPNGIPCYTLEQVETKYDLTFNTLVADCEGYLERFLNENPKLYEQLTLIIFEKDCPYKCNYDAIIEKLRANQFIEIVPGTHTVWRKNKN